MAQFRKKPVVIEAVQWTGNVETILLFAGDENITTDNEDVLTIHTQEGNMATQLGDWIIKGIKGEFYPCRDDIFEATYEPVIEGTI